MAIKKQNRGASITEAANNQPRNWTQRLLQFMALLIAVMIIAGITYLKDANTLPIKHVTVEGDFLYVDRDDLVKAISPFLSSGFLEVDVASIRAAGEQLPWIRQIQVRRIWPDTLHLVVEEQKAVARWNEDGLVNSLGVVFKPDLNTIPTGLLQMNGPEGSSELMARKLVNIQQQLKELGLKIKVISMDKRRSWQVDLNDGLHLKLGRAEGDVRLKRFINVYRSGLDSFKEKIKEIDMRYTNGLAVIWKDGKQPDFNGTV